jgi:hypothetical protein
LQPLTKILVGAFAAPPIFIAVLQRPPWEAEILAAILQDPRAQALLIPLLAALAVAWLGMTLAGRGRAADFWPALALAGALVLTEWLVAGPLGFPPNGAVEKLSYLALAALAVGLLAESLAGDRGLRAAALLWPWLAVGWIAWPILARLDWLGIAAAAAIAAAGSLVMGRLRESRGGAAPFLLFVAALALGMISYHGASYSMAQLMSALGMGLAGAALGFWMARGGGLAMGGPLLLVGGGAFVAMAAVLLLYTSAGPWPAAFLLPVFFADALAMQAVGGGGGLWKGLRAAVFLVAALAPAVAAVLLARHLSGGPLY